MEERIKIAFDIDGVVLDFTECFLRVAKEKFGILKNTEYSNVTRYEFHECIDVSYEKCFEIVNYIIANPFECEIKAVPGAVEVLTNISKHIPLVFVTARKEGTEEQTKKSIYSALPEVDKNRITIIHCRGSEKYLILNKLNINYFVDDRTRNCRNLNKQGINVFLFNRPWNQTEELFNRVNGWNEIHNFIFSPEKKFSLCK